MSLFWPILTYNLAKFLLPILSPLTVNEFTVHDLFSFAEEIVNFDANCIMASLDVGSLSTNIPLDGTIENCINDLFSNNDTVDNFFKEDLKELLKFTSYESFFIFDNEYYSQLDGVAMGSPLGPTLANAFFCHFKKHWLSDCPQDFCPNIYRRYADDTFATSNSHEQLKKFLDYMNTKYPNIKFTFEHEHNNSFSLLDVKICRQNNKLTASVFRKPTFNGVFTNLKSFIPTVYKFGLVYTLLHRCFHITSSYEKFHNEINALKQILKLNGYPTQFIDRCIKQFLQKLYITKTIQDTVNKKQLLIVLPFLGAQSFLVRKRLQSCIRNTIPYCSLRIAFQSKTRLSSPFRFKDIIPKEISSHFVYRFKCSCCNATYYEDSELHFFVRASEHLGMTPLTGKRVKNPKKVSYL